MAEVLEMSPEPLQQSLALRPASSTTKSFAISEYQYEPLAPGEIRMLILLPGEFESPLQGYISRENFDPSDCKLGYEALSYVWGSQTDPKPFHILDYSRQSSSAEVEILDIGPDLKSALRHLRHPFNTCTLDIGPNLESALRHLRQPFETRTIWCDAICINQNDVEERGVQVRGMGDIYRLAKRVVVWLGQETDDLYRATQSIKFLGSIFYYDSDADTFQHYSDTADQLVHKWAPVPLENADWQSLFDFFDLPWFKRLWVKQEIILAKGAAIFVIGKQEITWDDFRSSTTYLNHIGWHAEALDERKQQEFDELSNKAWDIFTHDEGGNILNTLSLVNECECLDPRDKIYGILGLHRKDFQIEPNYNKDHRDVYTDFSRQYMQSTMARGTFALCNTADDTTWMHPTWVPDFAKKLPQFTYRCNGGVAQTSQPQRHILSDDSCKVLGIHCGTISQCSSSVTPQNVMPSTCFEIIRSWILDVSSNRSQPFSQACIDELVCTISLGLINEHDLDTNWPLSLVTDILLRDMEWFSPHEPRDEQNERRLMSNFITYGICSNLLATTADGKFAQSVGTAQVEDKIYVFPGERVPIVLRTIEGGRYRVVGPCFMPSLMRREALLGQLPEGWKVQFRSKQGMRMVITDPDGQIQSEDPRLGELPPGWEKAGPDDDGYVWYRYWLEDVWSLYDPRLTPERLADRGVKFEELIIV